MTVVRRHLEAWSDAAPSHPLVHTDHVSLDAAALTERVRHAVGLLTSAGLARAGDRLALQCDREPAFLEVHLAALAMGITTLAMNPRYTASETAYLLGDAVPRLACLPAHHLDQAPSETHAWEAGTLRARLDAASPRPIPGVDTPGGADDDDVALLGYTSGTTGRPKGALFLHRNMDATIEALRQAWHMTQDDVLLHALPLFHIHGLVVAQHVALRAAASTVWLPGFEPERVLHAATTHRATVFMGVPTFYHRLLQVPEVPDLSRMRLWTSGSAPLPAHVHRQFRARFGADIVERYGMTEVGIVLSNPYEGARVPGSVGFPLPGIDVRIVDDEDRPCATCQVGELHVRGPSVFAGYLHLPEVTADTLVDGWMHTGDLGYADEEGRIFLQGRRHDMILVGGFNVYPLEIESTLRDHPGILDVAVVGVPDDDLGQAIVAHVVLRDDGPSPTDLADHCRHTLTGYKVPRAFVVTDTLPRNAMGKVDKVALRTMGSPARPTPTPR